MIKNIHPRDLIRSFEFVREPVDILTQKIECSSSSKIILNGGRGTGKSTVLYNLQDRKIGTYSNTIYTFFESIGTISNYTFNDSFFVHYYELCFSLKLLEYVKKYYSYTYENHFSEYEVLLDEIADKTDEFINNSLYENVKISKLLSTGEISKSIIKKIRLHISPLELSLAIDRFDWINGRSKTAQLILSEYFKEFDKVILSCDDMSYLNSNSKLRNDLYDDGYGVITADYGLDKDIIKHIIKKRIKRHNKSIDNNYNSFDENLIADEVYENLINKSKGNISTMLDATRGVVYMCECNKGYSSKEYSSNDINRLFNNEIYKQIKNNEQLRKMSRAPKFHL